MSCKLEPAIWSHDTGQWIPCFDRCQLIITWMSNIKELHVHGQTRLHICQTIIWSLAIMLRDSIVAVAVMRTRLRAIPLAMLAMRKSTCGFPFLSYMSVGLRLAACRSSAIMHLAKFTKHGKCLSLHFVFQVFELRSVEEMTEEWLLEKLKFFR